MGKRSNFERIEKDFYRTFDRRAGKALEPHIWHIGQFVEPFAGVGDLVEQMDELAVQCVYACDNAINLDKPEWIHSADAFDLDKESFAVLGNPPVISNPPWSRDILHRAIEHFAELTTTWFLFDADWMQTRQSGYLMRKYCTDIVAVGRLKWIPETKMDGKDNCAWYRFSADKYKATEFHGRMENV